MTHSYYPVALDLGGRSCLVVGGGALAQEKVEGLLCAGAQVATVAPEITPALAQLHHEGEISVHLRPYRPEDLGGVYLAYGASDDRELNARVAADARRAGVIVNAVDDIPNCDFFAMALVRRGDLQVAISTNGLSPAFARWMRETLDAAIPRDFGGLLTTLGAVRRELRASNIVPPYQRWKRAIDGEVVARRRPTDEREAQDRIRRILVGDDGSTSVQSSQAAEVTV